MAAPIVEVVELVSRTSNAFCYVAEVASLKSSIYQPLRATMGFVVDPLR